MEVGGVLQGSKIVLVGSYLRVSQAAGQVNILIFLLKIKFSPCMPINFVMQIFRGLYCFYCYLWLLHDSLVTGCGCSGNDGLGKLFWDIKKQT